MRKFLRQWVVDWVYDNFLDLIIILFFLRLYEEVDVSTTIRHSVVISQTFYSTWPRISLRLSLLFKFNSLGQLFDPIIACRINDLIINNAIPTRFIISHWLLMERFLFLFLFLFKQTPIYIYIYVLYLYT